jgi:hypothetical protein
MRRRRAATPGPSILAGCVRIGAMLARSERHIGRDGGVLRMCPFNIGGGEESAIGEHDFRKLGVVLLDSVHCLAQQAAVGAGGVNGRGDDEATHRIGDDLNIVGRPETAIWHLHDAGFCIAGRGAKRALRFGLLLIAAFTLLTFGLAFGKLFLCLGDPFAAFVRSPQQNAILSATTEPSATSGWINTCLQPSRRCRTTLQSGSGHTTTTVPTWRSAASHPPRN